jgi:hypothetical protein
MGYIFYRAIFPTGLEHTELNSPPSLGGAAQSGGVVEERFWNLQIFKSSNSQMSSQAWESSNFQIKELDEREKPPLTPPKEGDSPLSSCSPPLWGGVRGEVERG